MQSIPSHILITGASGGLGGALARQYAGRCTTLTVMGRDRQKLAALQADCQRGRTRVSAIVCDVGDAAAMAAAIIAADQRAPVDIVIANAGIGGATALAPVCGESGPVAGLIITVNTLGVINTVTPLLAAMVDRRGGKIVIVGSLAGRIGLPDAPAYSASKAAVAAYAHGLRRLLARSGVAVTLVSPGFIHTPMSATLPLAKPWAWTAERAAARIIQGVDRGASEIAFPWQLRAATRCATLLPARVVDYLLYQTSKDALRP